MEQEWIEQAGKLVELLGLKRKPVAITFTNEPFEVAEKRKAWICMAIKRASEGSSFVIDKETSACGGGTWHCGLDRPPAGDARRNIQAFLTGGEKLTHSIVSFQRMMDLTASPPTGLSDRILIGPLEEAKARPDLALFICNPEQACRLLTLDHYWDGIPPRIEIAGALCHGAIAYPVVTGRSNLTLGDWTARRMQAYEPDAVFVSIPYERMRNLIDAIDMCSAGTAEVHIPDALRRQIAGE